MLILAIDPGTTRSGWLALCDGKPVNFGVTENAQLLEYCAISNADRHVIEKVESFGMAVGAEVFETVYWTGRFAQALPREPERIGRRLVKVHLCGSAKAKDSNIRQALIDRYGGSEAIGRKATPGPLYGIAGDVWAALALAVYAAENP